MFGVEYPLSKLDTLVAHDFDAGAMENWGLIIGRTAAVLVDPTSQDLMRQMRVAGRWDIAEAFEREHQIASKFMQHHDFSEGVTALLVRKERIGPMT